MAADDYEVIVYKVLSYLYACIKSGVRPSVAKAKELANVNDVYWDVVVQGMLDKGLITAVPMRGWHSSDYLNMQITADGAFYVKENSKMTEVRAFLGRAFEAIIESAVAATIAYGAGTML